MEPETCTSAQGEDSDNDQNVRDSPPTAGEKSDEGQQSIISEQNLNWYRTTLAFAYLQPAFVPIVKDEMQILQENIKVSFGRKLCAEATAKDIKPEKNKMARFKHICTAQGASCQTLLCLIRKHTKKSVKLYEMLKDTDPQNWLTSPFEFVSLFLKDWMRCYFHDFPDYDITALCYIVKQCKPLMGTFDSTNINEVKNVRNRTMHQARLNIDQLEMEKNIDVILDFLQHIKALQIKALKNTDEIIKAIDIIKQLKVVSPDVPLVVQVIQLWLPSARMQFAHKRHVLIDLQKIIVYMENELARLTSGQEVATTITTTEEMTFQAEIEKLTDENQKLKQKTEDMAKKEKELKKENEELKKRLEAMESRNVGEVCRPKVISSQRSTGQTEYMTPDFSIPVDSGSYLDIDPPSAKTRLEEEELKRKISNLKEERQKLEEEITELGRQKVIVNKNIRQFVEIENTSPIRVIIGIVVGGFFGGLLGGPAGVCVGAAYGRAVGASAGGVTCAAIRVRGIYIDTSTKESCREGKQRLNQEIHDREQRISYLAGEIADQERVLSNI